ncbi:hypothetical protein [Streptomyces sp. NPDC056069]|uniref:hypothetical protein n=1 Tax=Streptomyces sp. NPDC056069 TaxID=3345702 RepID=UPI0035D9C461
MRRPALYRPAAVDTAWTHPYGGVDALAVFYNTGGNDPATPPAPAALPAPSPADIPPRTAPAAPAGPSPLIDRDSGLPMTQERLNTLMTQQQHRGRRKLLRELAEASGLPIDPETFNVDTFGTLLKGAEETRKAQLTADQQAAEELARREEALAAREATAQAREAAAAARDRESKVRAALARLNAHGDDQDDAYELVKGKLEADADDAAITAAAEALKERRPALFGGTPAPNVLPPAPGGAPAGGPPQRTPGGGKDAVREAARQRAISMGLRAPDAA